MISYHWSAEWRYTFSDVLQQQFLYCFTWNSFHMQLSLCFDPWIFQLSVRFWQVLVLFWWLSILVTVHKPCHVSRASRITTAGTIFTEICFGVSNEWFKSWSHVLLIKVKRLAKNFLAVRPEKVTRKKKRKKTRTVIAKLLALNANALNLSRHVQLCFSEVRIRSFAMGIIKVIRQWSFKNAKLMSFISWNLQLWYRKST